jgi:hypothetical protein
VSERTDTKKVCEWEFLHVANFWSMIRRREVYSRGRGWRMEWSKKKSERGFRDGENGIS